MIPMSRKPTHPGEILQKEYLTKPTIRPGRIAEALGVKTKRIKLLIKGKKHMTPMLALKLARHLGTTAEFWMHLQTTFDLWRADKKFYEKHQRQT